MTTWSLFDARRLPDGDYSLVLALPDEAAYVLVRAEVGFGDCTVDGLLLDPRVEVSRACAQFGDAESLAEVPSALAWVAANTNAIAAMAVRCG